MTDTDTDLQDNIPVAAIEVKRGLPIVWLLPIIAAAIGAWLVYKSIVEAGIEMTLHFPTGEGLAAGKTEVRYQGITLGVVDKIELEKDLDGVIASITVDRRAERVLRSGSQFWLVKPEVSFGGIKGLETLVQGNYIAVKLGPGQPQRDFVALDGAPPLDESNGGLVLALLAEDLGSVHIDSPVHYRKLTVGKVIDYQLQEADKQVAIKIYVAPEYTHLVHQNTRFWNSSGVSLSGTLPNIKLNVDSLAALIAGGISFDTPPHEAPGAPSQPHDQFVLYPDFETAQAGITVTIALDSAEGISIGHTQVKYKGIPVATVRNIRPSKDFDRVLLEVLFNPRAAFALNTSTRFWLVKPRITLSEISGLGTLITGTYLEMDFGEGEPQREFIALQEAPALDRSVPGLHLRLKTDSLGGLNIGSEIYYRQIPIGTVQNYTLDESQAFLLLDIHIQPAYQHLISPATRFYHASGIKVSGGLTGLKLETQSVASLLKGGIAIENPDRPPKTATLHIKNGHQFTLHSDRVSAMEQGVAITIEFSDGEGLKAGTKIKYKGIMVGNVDSVKLNPKTNRVSASATLLPSASHLARHNTEFWITRAQLGLSGSANLGTLISGVYISVKPGIGKKQVYFVGLARAPISTRPEKNGLSLVLHARQLGSLKPGALVYYRNVPVGKVTGYELGSTAQFVDISINIEERYARLVTTASKFWNASGVAVDFRLFRGTKIRTESLESILAGGIAFATPEEGENAKTGTYFTLHEEVEEEWLQWQPAISLPAQ